MINALIIMLILGGALGALLAVSSKVFHVEVDTRIQDVTSLLPGYNCGACGYPGCAGLAEALVNKETDDFACKVCDAKKKEEILNCLKDNGEKA